MAAIARGLFRIGVRGVKRECMLPPCGYSFRAISTSKKNKDSLTHHHEEHRHHDVNESKLVEKFGDTGDKQENWISYGYDVYNKEDDKFWNKAYMFGTITLCICGGGFILAYMPDHRLSNWSQREAYLELTRREKNDLPLIDPNVVDPSVFLIPSDKELQDFKIKI